MPNTLTMYLERSPMKITLYFILFVMLTVSSRAGDTVEVAMEFRDVFKHMPPKPSYAKDMEGTVLLDLRIDKDGYVADIHFVDTAGDIVDSMFAKALRRLKGSPRRIDDKPVDTWVRQQFILRYEYGGKGLDKYENAFFNYTRSLENDTTNSAVRFYGRGRAHYLFGDIEAARTDFATARSLGCTQPWYEEHQMELARQWLPADTTSFDSLLVRATFYGRYGLFERARELYLRLSRMQPKELGPLRGLMLLYGDRRDYENAASIAAALVQHRDLTWYDLQQICWWLYSAGRYDRAVATGEAATTLSADWTSRSLIAVNYSIALLSQGHLSAARAEYKQITTQHMEEAVGDLKRHIRLGRPHKEFAREILTDIFHLDRDEMP